MGEKVFFLQGVGELMFFVFEKKGDVLGGINFKFFILVSSFESFFRAFLEGSGYSILSEFVWLSDGLYT